ncbi:unnamed protein product [Orchesella dallaii]|uniref:small monomeric GTPase n=1 Tax=Orchesella dallaii TaxID=48710 RepID=A0ABP1RYC2_9HEXA
MDTIATAHNDNRDNAEIKIILVGDKGVGKSTLLDQFWGPNSNGTQPTASMRYSSPFVETMIIGNKSDLEEQRVISKEQGQELSSQLGALAFREMSVVNFNQEPFIWMLMGIYLRRKLRNQDATEKQRIKKGREDLS